jgi:hypothetical protein
MFKSEKPNPAQPGCLPVDMPLCAAWRDRMLEAVVVASAILARKEGHIAPSVRMRLLAETRRSGLLDLPPQLDVLALLDQRLAVLVNPVAARRLASRTLSDFVGTPWAPVVLDMALKIGQPEEPPLAGSPDPAKVVRLALGLLR